MNIYLDPILKQYYERFPLMLIDVGASGGIPALWQKASEYLQVIGFEPDEREYGGLAATQAGDKAQKIRYLNTALHKNAGTIEYFLTRKQQASSVFQPNQDFLRRFPDAERFDVVRTVELQVDMLDHQLVKHGLEDADFIKLDTQGSELYILEGAAKFLKDHIFGLEIEVSFAPIYKNAPFFSDVDMFVREHGFQLVDVKSYWWKRKRAKNFGRAKGQIVFADVLFFKEPKAFCDSILRQKDHNDFRLTKILKAVAICLLYGYLDYAVEVVEQATTIGIISDSMKEIVLRGIQEYNNRQIRLPNFPFSGKLGDILYSLSRLFKSDYNDWIVADRRLGNL